MNESTYDKARFWAKVTGQAIVLIIAGLLMASVLMALDEALGTIRGAL